MRKSKRSGRGRGGVTAVLFFSGIVAFATVAIVKQLPEIRRYIKAVTM